eukprot:gene4612-7994_t
MLISSSAYFPNQKSNFMNHLFFMTLHSYIGAIMILYLKVSWVKTLNMLFFTYWVVFYIIYLKENVTTVTKRLDKNLESYEQIFVHVESTIMKLNKKLDIIFINKDFFDLKKEELIGKNIKELFNDKEFEEKLKDMKKLPYTEVKRVFDEKIHYFCCSDNINTGMQLSIQKAIILFPHKEYSNYLIGLAKSFGIQKAFNDLNESIMKDFDYQRDLLIFDESMSPLVEKYVKSSVKFGFVISEQKHKKYVNMSPPLYIVELINTCLGRLSERKKSSTPEENITKFYLFEEKIKIRIAGDPNLMKGTLTSTKFIPEKIHQYLIKIYSQIMNLQEYIDQFNNFDLKDFKFLHFGKVEKLNLKDIKFEQYKKYKIDTLKTIHEEWNKKDLRAFINEFESKERLFFDKQIFCDKFTIEKKKKKEIKTKKQFKWEKLLESMQYQSGKLNEEIDEKIEKIEENTEREGEKSEFESFSTIFHKLYENLFIYNQTPQYYTNPREIRSVLSSDQSDDFKENAIIDYIKQNLNPSFL